MENYCSRRPLYSEEIKAYLKKNKLDNQDYNKALKIQFYTELYKTKCNI